MVGGRRCGRGRGRGGEGGGEAVDVELAELSEGGAEGGVVREAPRGQAPPRNEWGRGVGCLSGREGKRWEVKPTP